MTLRLGGDGAITGCTSLEEPTLSISGLTVTTPIEATSGTAAAPSYTFSGDTDNGLYYASTNSIGLSTAGTNAILIDSSGRVGIGNTVMSSFTGNSSDNLVVGNGSGSEGITVYSAAQGSVTFADGTSGNAAYRGAIEYNHTADQLAFRTAGTGNRMVIDSLGKVGIGTSTSRASLTVAKGGSSIPAAGANTASAVFSNDADAAVYGLIAGANASGTGYLQAQRTDGNAIVYPLAIQPNGGNVGIGTSSPSTKLDVVEAGAFSAITASSDVSTTGLASRFALGNSVGTARFTINMKGGGGEEAYLGSEGNFPIYFQTNGAERMRIDSSGGVGIGITNPSEYHPNANKLVIDGGMTFANVNGGNIYFADSSTGTGEYVGQINYYHSQNALQFVTNNSEAMRIDSSGDVGIGTGAAINLSSSGRQTLALNGTSETAISFSHSGSLAAFLYTSSSEFRMQSEIAVPLVFRPNNSEAMRLDSSGRLLLGNTGTITTNGQDCALQVVGSSASTSRIAIINRGNDATGGGIQIVKSRGTIPQSVTTNDQVGGIFWCAGDGNDYASQAARIECFIDALPGGSDTPGRLVFSTTPDQTDSPVERMRLSKEGRLDVFSSDTPLRPRSASSAGVVNALIFGLHSATSTSNGTNSFIVWSNGNVQNTNDSYGQISDVKLKENIVDADSQWDDFKAVRFRKYNFKEETGYETHTQLGVIAQELELTSPGLVYETADKDEDGNDLGTTTKAVKSSILTKKALVALQEAMDRIETLEAKVAALET